MTGCQLLIIDLLYKNFEKEQLNVKRFPVFPEGISNSSRFPVFPEVEDTRHPGQHTQILSTHHIIHTHTSIKLPMI